MDMTTITIDPSHVLGPVKPMNAVNNGPIKTRRDQSRGNFAAFRDARIPFARTHDANLFSSYGAPHTVDITAIFPDFSADVEDPASYDFAPTDHYLEAMVDAGTEVFFRLGESIEHGVRKYNIHPPRDNAKWARICEHVIRHYTEGWADGRNWRLRYWEIWGEPDVWPEGTYGTPFWDARTWGGTSPQFLELYRVAALHLKKCFPHLKIGGPGLGWNWEWAEIFLAYMRAHDVPIDFFSWHIYSTEPREIAARCDRARQGDYREVIFAPDWPREVLYRRIDARVDEMLAHGLVDEVRRLMADPRSHPTAMQAIGYKEIAQALRGEASMEDAICWTKTASRNLAKRQLTWFRHDDRVIWLKAEGESPEALAGRMMEIIEGKA